MHKYVLFGPQGSGKGTQAKLLARDYDFVHISIGDIFRWHTANHTKLAARIKRILDSGNLVPDETVYEVVSQRLEEHDWNYGFILDGFPRTRHQAEFLFERWNLDKAIFLDVPDEVVIERVMHRAKMGEGSGFTKRADDNPEALKQRMRDYQEKTAPLIELYGQREMLIKVDATQEIGAISCEIRNRLGLKSESQKA
jgi:adenylate kinase